MALKNNTNDEKKKRKQINLICNTYCNINFKNFDNELKCRYT